MKQHFCGCCSAHINKVTRNNTKRHSHFNATGIHVFERDAFPHLQPCTAFAIERFSLHRCLAPSATGNEEGAEIDRKFEISDKTKKENNEMGHRNYQIHTQSYPHRALAIGLTSETKEIGGQ